jgi:hypothetical protein
MTLFDWIYIGSNGFAQLGDPLYSDKNLAEKAIIFQLLEEKEELHIPEEFKGIARYSWKAQQHDFGIYHDLTIKYDDMYISLLEDSDEEKHDRFWNWVNTVESFDFETQEITNRIEKKYNEMFPDAECKVIHLKKTA